MTRWIGMRLHGELVRDTDTDMAPVQEGVTFLEVPGDLPVSISSQYWDGSGFVDKGRKPSEFHVFDYTKKIWFDPRTPETEWSLVRTERDTLLMKSDWTQLPDVPISTKDKWSDYRQKLRDITDQLDPFNIDWPTPP